VRGGYPPRIFKPKLMNFTFVSTGQYPDTQAAAIRHSLLAKGLTEQGHNVSFLMLSAQEWNKKKSIDFFGVHFIELNHYKGTNKILVRYHTLQAIFKVKKILKLQAKQKKPGALVIFTIDLLPIRFLLSSAHAMGMKVFHERTELPYVYKANKAVLDIYLKKYIPRFDGIFVISDKLSTYIQQFNASTQKLLTVVDLSLFSTITPSPYPFPYIGYCGTISGNKDGVPILIEAFAYISDRFPLLKLVLVGNNSNKEAIKETLDTIERFHITDKVIFTGLIERNMMPVVLCNAEILVVSKPDNEQNSGNFPIKIGEYLATGVPVVVTSVGEIPSFIKDGESGFLAVPGSAKSFAEKMEQALANPAAAKKIGLAGKKIAADLFDYKIQARIMGDYIIKKINQQ